MSDDDPDIWPWTMDPSPEPFTMLDWAVIAAAVAILGGTLGWFFW